MASPSSQATPTPAASRAHITVVTPSRRAFSAEPTPLTRSGRRSIHTPLDNSVSRDLRSSIRRGNSTRANNAPTPHARAAIRALDLRRAAVFTPGRNRRRSLRDQRETPRDILRNLSRVLAPASQLVNSSPRDRSSIVPSILEESEDDDSELPIDKPRLSLPLGIDGDDDSPLQPPRSSGLEDENFTMQSIELGRRAISEQPPSRLSRGSFGSIQFSDFGQNELDMEDVGIDSGFFPQMALEDIRREVSNDDASFQRIDGDARRTTMGFGRESGFGLDVLPDGNESTFMMNVQPPPDDEPSLPVPELEPDAATDSLLPDLSAVDLALPWGDDEVFQSDGNEIEGDEEGTTEIAAEDMADAEAHAKSAKKRKKGVRLSRYGHEYPSLPPAVVKRLAQTFAQTSGISKSKISQDTLSALCQATDWFFEQLGDDLQAYAHHAGRKTIDESDVITLMRRQRQIGPSATPFSLAQRHLPRELLQDVRMPVPVTTGKKRRRVENDDDNEEG